MLTMGGPESESEVRPYLRELFQDRELLRLPAQKFLGEFIAWRRTPFIISRYKELGQYSPTHDIMKKQAELISSRLDEISPETAPHACYPAFRYAQPRTEDVVLGLESNDQPPEKVILFAQYPQHSCSTSGSSFCDAYRKLSSINANNPAMDFSHYSVIDRWYNLKSYTKLWSDLIEKKLEEMKEEHGLADDEIHLIYSAHSLPQDSCFVKGDEYDIEVQETVGNVEQMLRGKGWKHRSSLGWQSKVGPKKRKWLEPNTKDVIKETKEPCCVIVPIAFVTDHIETIDEIDIEFKEDADEVDAIKYFDRVECFNDKPEFANLAADIIHEHINSNYKSKIRHQCPKCEGTDCGGMRQYFRQNNRKTKDSEKQTAVN